MTDEPNPGPTRKPPFEERMERFPDTAARVWGLIVLAAGLWFFADVTLGVDMPAIPWGDIWPIGIVVVGLVILVRGMGRRAA